jgi:DNA-binding transcriptional ArsR family regulator
MNRIETVALDSTFTALADPNRRAMISALLQKPRRAGELASLVRMSPPALSRHLRVLRRAGLIVEHSLEEDARVRVYGLDPHAFSPVRSWLEQVEAMWQTQLEAFKAHAERARATRGSSA